MKRHLLITGTALLLSACSVFDSEPDKKPLAGERISILDLDRELRPSATVNAADVIIIPKAIKNSAWPQNGGYPDHVMQNLVLAESAQIQKIWKSSIGRGATKDLPLTAKPVIGDGKIFTLNTKSGVRAFHDQTGKMIWETNVKHLSEEDSVISGGVAYDKGALYVTSGYNEVLALVADTGDIKWRTKISAGSRAAPTIKNGRVFVTALNNNVIALDATSGKTIWEYEGVGETTGLLGAASPTVDDQIAVAALSTGDLVALRVENGSVVWSDSLSNSLRLGGMAGLSDIRALPIMNGDMLVAISFGGKMVAYDKRNGAILWQKEISGAETPWMAGNTLYVISSNHKLIAMNAINGEILWISNLPKYKAPEDREGLLTWVGPVMGGGRLMTVGTHGQVNEYNPISGEITKQWTVKERLKSSPIIAGGGLYFLSLDGSLIAYR